MPDKVKIKYIKNMTTEIDKRAQILYAKRRAEEEGFAKGLEKGLAQMLEEKLAIARKMKADGLSAEIIIKYTGLSAEQIAGL